MLLSWSWIYKHGLPPHRYYLWNNRDILYKHKSLYFANWFQNGIYVVSHLLNTSGHLLSYSEFLNKFDMPIPPKECAIVFGSIRSGA